MSTIQHVDPRVVRTRRLLIDALVSLMAEHTYDTITITQITARATVNRATFYAHFADKRELSEAMVRENFGRVLDHMADTTTDDLAALLGSLFRAAVHHRNSIHANCQSQRHTSDELRLFEAMMESEIRLQLRERVHDWFSRQTEPADEHPQGRCMLLASLISAALYAAVIEWSSRKDNTETDIDLMVERLARMARP